MMVDLTNKDPVGADANKRLVDKPDHVHEWFLGGGGALCFHPACDAKLKTHEAEAMLNAAERLSAAQARGAHKILKSNGFDCPEQLEYAKARGE